MEDLYILVPSATVVVNPLPSLSVPTEDPFRRIPRTDSLTTRDPDIRHTVKDGEVGVR